MVTMMVEIAHLLEQTKALKLAPEATRSSASFAASLEERSGAVSALEKRATVALRPTEGVAAASASEKVAAVISTPAIHRDSTVDSMPDGEVEKWAVALPSIDPAHPQESNAGVAKGATFTVERLRRPKEQVEVKTGTVPKHKTKAAIAELVNTAALDEGVVGAPVGAGATSSSALEVLASKEAALDALSGLDKSVKSNGRTQPKAEGLVGDRVYGASRKAVDPGVVSTAKVSAEPVVADAARMPSHGRVAVADASEKLAVAASPVAVVQAGGVVDVAVVAHASAGGLQHQAMLHGPTRETAIPAALGDLPQAQAPSLRGGFEAGDALGHSMLATTTKTLEVGVVNGPNGWLKIRAEMDEGVVTASLSARSIAGQEMLHRELPSLTTYLQEERVSVHAVVVERAAASSVMTSEPRAGTAGGEGDAYAPGSGREQGREYVSDPAWGSAEEDVPHMELKSGLPGLSGLQHDTGGWLNVRV